MSVTDPAKEKSISPESVLSKILHDTLSCSTMKSNNFHLFPLFDGHI